MPNYLTGKLARTDNIKKYNCLHCSSNKLKYNKQSEDAECQKCGMWQSDMEITNFLKSEDENIKRIAIENNNLFIAFAEPSITTVYKLINSKSRTFLRLIQSYGKTSSMESIKNNFFNR